MPGWDKPHKLPKGTARLHPPNSCHFSGLERMALALLQNVIDSNYGITFVTACALRHAHAGLEEDYRSEPIDLKKLRSFDVLRRTSLEPHSPGTSPSAAYAATSPGEC